MYGQTEVMPATMGDARRPAKPGSSGRPQSGLQVRIVDDAGTPLPAGMTGEIVIRPRRPHAMFEGYLGSSPSATPDTWFHTGDLGRVDDDGDLFFADRKADHIRRRGHNVSSAEIEDGVSAHPAIADVAAYAVAAEEAEDEVMITVVLRPGAKVTVDDLLAFCAERLPHYALPRLGRRSAPHRHREDREVPTPKHRSHTHNHRLQPQPTPPARPPNVKDFDDFRQDGLELVDPPE